MKKQTFELFRLEDRVLFEAAAAAEIVEAAEIAQDNPNANVNEGERQAQAEKDALKNAPAENPAAQSAPNHAASNDPSKTADIDAQVEQLIQGEIPASDADLDDASLAVGPGAPDASDSSGLTVASDSPGLVDVLLQDSGATISTGKELVVINKTVPDRDTIVAALKPNQEVLILDDSGEAGKILSGMTFVNNDAAVNGGAIYSFRGFTLEQGVFTGNRAVNGGGVYVAGGTLTMTGGTISYNTATDSGGGIYAASGATADIDGTGLATGQTISVDYNKAGSGGGIFGAAGSTLTVKGTPDKTLGTSNVSISNNEASLKGRGVYAHGTTTLDGISVTENTAAASHGGALYAAGNIVINGGKYSKNLALTNGGAVYAGDRLMVTHSEFRGNTSALNGGAAYAGGASVTMDNTLIADNTAAGNGGAIYLADTAVAATLTNLTIAGNTAAAGGGIHTVGNNVTLQNSILWGNKKANGDDDQYFGLDHRKVFCSGIQGWSYADNGKITAVRADRPVIIDIQYNGDGNWKANTTEVTVTTAKRDITISAADRTVTYDGQDHNLAWDNDTSGFVLDDYMDTYDCPAYRCAGTYTGTQVIDNAKFASGTRGDLTGNYNITYEGELVITQATITVERNGVDKIYDGTLHADYTWNMIGKITGDDVQYHEGSAFFHDKNVGGNKPILINGDSLSGSDLSNYTVVFTGADADITPRSLTIIIDDATKQEGEPDPEFTWTDNLAAGDTITGVDRSDTSELPGEYAIDEYLINDGNGGNNYSPVFVTQGTLTILAGPASDAGQNTWQDGSSFR